jgi:hypothetical protein
MTAYKYILLQFAFILLAHSCCCQSEQTIYYIVYIALKQRNDGPASTWITETLCALTVV